MALLQRSSLSQGHSRNTRIRPSPQQHGPGTSMYSLFSNDFSASVSGSACNVQSIEFYATLLDLAMSLIGEGMSVLWFLVEGQMSNGKWSAYVLRKSKRFSTLSIQDI